MGAPIKKLSLVLVALAALALPAVSAAKEPTAATIEGPGLSTPTLVGIPLAAAAALALAAVAVVSLRRRRRLGMPAV
jgi:hypothetical protein